MTQKTQGMTLLELLIAVAICGILFGVAVPAYRSQLQSGRLHETQLKMMEIYASQQNFYLQTGRYAEKSALPSVQLPGFQWNLENLTEHSFTLVATGVAGAVPAHCTRITMNHQAQRSPADCWPR
ncbi:prepilin-type N-terminal cleavage/methylation domain-containing protein [Alteromonas aestuariivivens]|uniref:Prepilin-type N-terminal cleavage/methylation domain-containing protein n=1 Tax=Alteromonas aestuariivivens TaxID=1938339 RepID=A0A3D8MFB1_9ALTE|nr:type IV pilin protein [Alteromonas aestuariivivens]RDV29442.1 prepilin-type N-terminal cleavage/methylation domain-containing protein [Alteromonas aestuariivivens]